MINVKTNAIDKVEYESAPATYNENVDKRHRYNSITFTLSNCQKVRILACQSDGFTWLEIEEVLEEEIKTVQQTFVSLEKMG